MADPEAYREKKREQYRASIGRLVEAGLYEPSKPGRKRLYTPEEAIEVAKKQRHEGYLRRRAPRQQKKRKAKCRITFEVVGCDGM